MAGIAETIVLGNKLYQAGKQIKRSAQGVGKGLDTYNKKQAQAQKKQQPKVQKNTPAPKPVAKPTVKTAPVKPVSTKPVAKPTPTKKPTVKKR